MSSGPGWHFDPRGWVEVTGDGAVLSRLYIPYNVNVAASNVTLKDLQVAARGNGFGISLRNTRDVTIEDCEIYSPSAGSDRLEYGIKDIFGNSTGLKILRDDIWHTKTGVQLESGLVADSYIHNPGFRPGDHVNGITSDGGDTLPLTIRHDTILVGMSQTDAIGLFEDFGIQANRDIDDNLLAGGGYTIYGGQNHGGPASHNIVITNNLFSRIYYTRGGRYGYIAYFKPQGHANVWSGNSWSNNTWTKATDIIASP